jgi:hypothetical protein
MGILWILSALERCSLRTKLRAKCARGQPYRRRCNNVMSSELDRCSPLPDRSRIDDRLRQRDESSTSGEREEEA